MKPTRLSATAAIAQEAAGSAAGSARRRMAVDKYTGPAAADNRTAPAAVRNPAKLVGEQGAAYRPAPVVDRRADRPAEPAAADTKGVPGAVDTPADTLVDPAVAGTHPPRVVTLPSCRNGSALPAMGPRRGSLPAFAARFAGPRRADRSKIGFHRCGRTSPRPPTTHRQTDPAPPRTRGYPRRPPPWWLPERPCPPRPPPRTHWHRDVPDCPSPRSIRGWS